MDFVKTFYVSPHIDIIEVELEQVLLSSSGDNNSPDFEFGDEF